MAKTFVDQNFLTWEAYPSGGPFGFPDKPFIMFNCVSDSKVRPRSIEFEGDEADAERAIQEANKDALLKMFEQSKEIR